MNRLVKHINVLCAKLTVKQLRIFLIAICIVGILFILNAMLYPPPNILNITPINKPQNVLRSTVNIGEKAIYYQEAYRKIKQYKLMLNDSVIKARPGLADTLNYLELFYQKQFKK